MRISDYPAMDEKTLEKAMVGHEYMAYVVELKDGSFVYFTNDWDFHTAAPTDDIKSVGYIGSNFHEPNHEDED